MWNHSKMWVPSCGERSSSRAPSADMLFNSYTFIFAFLPITAIIFFILGKSSREWALRWLMLASLVFYAWWRPINVLLIAPSILINYGLARALERTGEERPLRARAILLAGIV